MDEADLVRQALGGDGEAYTQLARGWAAWVVALCHARIGSADAATDLALEALLRGFEELPALADPGRFGPWLAEIVHRACRERLSAVRTADSGLGVEREGRAAPEGPEAEVLRQAEALPEESRMALIPFYYRKADYRDLARLLGWPTAAVRARLAQARAALLKPGQDEPAPGPTAPCGLADTLVSARLDGEIDAGDREMVDQHVAGCPTCRATLDAWAAHDARLRSAFASLQPAVSAVVSSAQSRLTSRNLRRFSVLVVDDEEYVLTTLVKLLSADYDVTAARDAGEAEKVLASHPVEVLLTDQRMPRR
ncbi:MAG: zf-HC2 domain-containing protein, partial [Gemmataceae bacterium]